MIYMRKAIKNCYIDANILIFLQNKKSLNHQKTRLLFNKLLEEGYKVYISSLVIDEYLYNIYRLLAGDKLDKLKMLKLNLKKVFKIPGIELVNPSPEVKKHDKVINLMAKYNLHPRDAYHLFIMLENRIKYLATFDNDFDSVFKKGLVKKFS